jgi:fructose-1,6-bisphosphatase/inositol monophosphatase family enzyme
MECCRSERLAAKVTFKPAKRLVSPLVAIGSRIVTTADIAVQEAILRSLLNDGLVNCYIEAEEDTPAVGEFRPRKGAPVIFVDPIDGTLTFSVVCPDWHSAATAAGFEPQLVTELKSRLDPRFYGIVLGARVDGHGVLSVCALPELDIIYHSISGVSFRNDEPLRVRRKSRPTLLAIGRRLLDSDGIAASPFDAAGISYRSYNGSNPAVLWNILEADCTAYTGLHCNFDAQLASVIARSAGLLVTDRDGRDFVTDLSGPCDGLVYASTEEEIGVICSVMREYP